MLRSASTSFPVVSEEMHQSVVNVETVVLKKKMKKLAAATLIREHERSADISFFLMSNWVKVHLSDSLCTGWHAEKKKSNPESNDSG